MFFSPIDYHDLGYIFFVFCILEGRSQACHKNYSLTVEECFHVVDSQFSHILDGNFNVASQHRPKYFPHQTIFVNKFSNKRNLFKPFSKGSSL